MIFKRFNHVILTIQFSFQSTETLNLFLIFSSNFSSKVVKNMRLKEVTVDILNSYISELEKFTQLNKINNENIYSN